MEENKELLNEQEVVNAVDSSKEVVETIETVEEVQVAENVQAVEKEVVEESKNPNAKTFKAPVVEEKIQAGITAVNGFADFAKKVLTNPLQDFSQEYAKYSWAALVVWALVLVGAISVYTNALIRETYKSFGYRGAVTNSIDFSNFLRAFLFILVGIALLITVDWVLGKVLANAKMNYLALAARYGQILLISTMPLLVLLIVGSFMPLIVLAVLFIVSMLLANIGIVSHLFTRANSGTAQKVSSFYFVVIVEVVMVIVVYLIALMVK